MTQPPDLSLDPHALHVRKRPLPVAVTFATEDGICATLEGPVPFRRGDAILTGVQGEHWPVTRDRFESRYAPADGQSMGQDGNYLKHPQTVLARRLDAPLQVMLPAGGRLTGKPGDWLLQYAPDDYGIIAEEIFRTTYAPVADQDPRSHPASPH